MTQTHGQTDAELHRSALRMDKMFSCDRTDEIMRQAKAFADGGGRFIVPVPVPRVVEP